jgi:hypothetical protein
MRDGKLLSLVGFLAQHIGIFISLVGNPKLNFSFQKAISTVCV